MVSFSKVNKEYVVIGSTLLLIAAMIYYAWHRDKEKEAMLQKPIVMSQQDAQDKNVLQNKLELNKQNAEMLASFVSRAQTGAVQPVAHFAVQAPSLPQAAEQVTNRIIGRDPTLPPLALERTDNTVVTTEKLNEEQQAAAKKVNEEYGVEVYKNNNYQNWEWSIGYGQQNGERYIPIGLQRNYSKAKAIEVEVHLDLAKSRNITGWEVKHILKTEKLFGLI